MKKTLTLLCLAWITHLQAAVIEINTRVTEVTLYHSGALVTRSMDLDLQPGAYEIVIKNVSSKLLLNTLRFRNRNITLLNSSLQYKMTAEEMHDLTDRKDAISNQITLLEAKFSESGFVHEINELEKMMDYYPSRIRTLKKELRVTEKQIEDARKMESVQLAHDNAAILHLGISISSAFKGKLMLQYITGGIGWSPSYEIYVKNRSDNKLSIKYMAKMMSQTGEDWEDVIFHLSSAFPLSAPLEIPRADEPWTLSRSTDYKSNESAAKNNIPTAESNEIARLEGVRYQTISVPANIRLRTLEGKHTLKSNSTVFTFPILQTELKASFYYYSFPMLDPDAYIVADVTGWDTLGFVDGLADITVENNEIGKSIIRFSDFSDTLQLPIGKDNSLYIERKELPNKTYSREMNLSKKVRDRVDILYSLRNQHSTPVHLRLVDQVPISQIKSTDISIEKTSGGTLSADRGEVTWELDLQPGKTITRELVFEVEAGTRYYRGSKPRTATFRTISCPSF